MSRLIAGSVLVFVLVLGTLTAIGYAKYRQIEAASSVPPPPESPVTVSTMRAIDRPFRKSSVVIGTLLASQSVTLRNELTGVVTEVRVKPGDVVDRGDVLIQFDTQLETAELNSAMASQRLADSALKRNERLMQSGAASVQLMDEAAADASRTAAEVERIGVIIEKKTLLAPFDARVGLFDLHPGQYLPAGSEITQLSGISDYLDVDFAMPQAVANQVDVGDLVEIISVSHPEPLLTTIRAVDASANLQSRSLMARARLQNPPQGMHPGDSVKVKIPYGPTIHAVSVASTAIRRGPSGTSLFVAAERDGQTRAEYRPIRVLGSVGSQTWVAEGITADEVVVTDGSFKIADGTLLGIGGDS